MNSVFGVPTSTFLVVLLIVCAGCLGAAGIVFLRNRVVFRLGIRNLPRRPAQSVLIVVGLMLSTVIIAAAFTTGDTLDHSIRSEVLEVLGPTDEVVVLSSGAGDEAATALTGAQLPEHVAASLQAALAGNPNVDGILPVLSEPVPAIDLRTSLSEPALQMTGLDPASVASFGGLRDVDGNAIDLRTLNGIVLGETAAEKLDAAVGDSLLFYVDNRAHQWIVKAIAPDSPLTGSLGTGGSGGFAIPLIPAQTMLGEAFSLSYVAISNRGGVEDGVALTEEVVAAVNAELAGTPYRALPIKQDGIADAEREGNLFLQVFLIFGLFSIAVGILLIFLIFVMLAAERKPEMGMARAVGLKRRQVTELFLAEGIAYDLVAALVGAALGVGIALLMVRMLGGSFGAGVEIQPIATWQSLLISWTLGVVVTFVTILVSAWKVSKLNITQAIRDVDEPKREREGRRWLVGGALGVVLGLGLLWLGTATTSMFAFGLGFSLVPLSLAGLLRRFGLPGRLVFSLAALVVIVFWLLPGDVFARIFPELTGGIEMFFVSGITLVAAATLLIVWNADAIAGGVSQLGRASSRWLPAVRTAVSYPMANRARTGMTVAMFSLVVFSLVMMAAINVNLVAIFASEQAGGGWDIQAVQAPTNPLDDISLALAENGVDSGIVEAAARVESMPLYRSQVRMAGASEWGTYTISGVDDAFLTHSDIPLQTRAEGYASDAAVWAALRAEPDAAVIDAFAVPAQQFGDLPFLLEGVAQDDETMTAPRVEIADPATGATRTLRVLGIIDSQVFTQVGLFVPQATFHAVFPQPAAIVWNVRLRPEVNAEAAADQIEAALISYGVQAQSLQEAVDEAMRAQTSFMRLFEGFMALGLVVGIAAVGVIAFRSVVERRQQIGMLRAIGYQRRMVSASFVIESLMITLLGILSGTVLGLLLGYNLITSDAFIGHGNAGFVIPWLEIGVFIAISLVASLVMAWVPARRASRVPIAQALRYE